MLDIINLILSTFGNCFTFIDSFRIGDFPIIRILIILFIFRVAINFLFKNKRGD